MAREDLITSAVSFLRDPSVASSPLDKRRAFLRSKNLTQEEVDIALARAGGESLPADIPISPPNSHRFDRGVPSDYGYGSNAYYGGPWMQPPQPRRDWRDWFIMATVTGGIGYGLYTAAQRYIFPLISPPTPPQLEQDKAAVDASFARAFALIDQLLADTSAIKDAETTRTEKLDATIREIDTTVAELKAANTRRETEARIVANQVDGLKELVPKSLEGWKQGSDARLEELAADIASLKRLLENRVGLSSSSSAGGSSGKGSTSRSVAGKPASSPSSHSSPPGAAVESTSAPSHLADNESPPVEASSSANPASFTPTLSVSTSTPSPASYATARKNAGRATIPAWQMASGSGSSAQSRPNPNASTPSDNSSSTGQGITA